MTVCIKRKTSMSRHMQSWCYARLELRSYGQDLVNVVVMLPSHPSRLHVRMKVRTFEANEQYYF